MWMKHVNANFLIQVTDKPSLLDLLPWIDKNHVGMWMSKGTLVAITIMLQSLKSWVEWERPVVSVTVLVFMKADLALFRELLGRTHGIIQWRTQKSWQIFKDTLLKAQVQTLRKPSKYGREWPKMGEESDYLEKGRHCLSMQDADIRSQSSAGAETSYRCEKQKWGRLQYWQQNNNYILKRWNHCSTEQGPNGKGDGKIKTT